MRWPWQSRSDIGTGYIGIALHPSGALAAVASGVVSADGGRKVLGHCFQPLADWQALGVWARQLPCRRVRVVLVLPSDRYQLQLLDALPVADSELADAMRFRLGELADVPLEQLLVQAFRLPEDAYRGRQNMVFVAMSPRDSVQTLVNHCREQQLRIEAVTITELALLGLLEPLEPETSIAILELEKDNGRLLIYSQGALYLRRDLQTGAAALTTELAQLDNNSELTVAGSWSDSLSVGESAPAAGGFQRLDTLALEIQRSLDYFDSQQGMGVVGQLWLVAAIDELDDSLLLALEQRLAMPCRRLSLGHWIESDGNALTASALGAAWLALDPLWREAV